MVTAVGLLLLVLACAGFALWRGSTAWRGDKHAGYETKASTNKGRLIALQVGVRTRTALEFELKPEGWLDRTAKAIGLTVEGQLGRSRIDDALFLVVDEPRVIAALRADTALADALHGLFAQRSALVDKVKRVVCRGGVLRIVLKTSADSGDVGRIADTVAPDLKDICQRLASAHPGSPVNDRLWWRATLLLAIASGIAVHGALEGFRLLIVRVPDTLDDRALWTLALPVALVVLLTLAAATVLLLGRTSRAHLVLAEVLLLGALGAPLGATAELRDLNMEADDSPARTERVSVVDMQVHRGRKGRRSYHVYLAPWDGRDGPYDLQVSSGEYERFYPGEGVQLRLRAGYLGIAWLEAVEPAPR